MNASGIKQWFSGITKALLSGDLNELDKVYYPPYREMIRQVSRPVKSGTNIFEESWDVLLVLDACRLDLMLEVLADRATDWTVNEIESVDTMTAYWMEKTFTPEYQNEISETIYLCANPHSESKLSEGDFHLLDEIWKYDWDDETGTVLAEDVTDEAIALRHKYPRKRLLVHYMQPHNPFLSDLSLNTKGTSKDDVIDHEGMDPWHQLKQGKVKKSRVWQAYRENLEYAISEVERLLENIDAETVVITSDHGNAIGEWGIYGHPHGMPFRCLRTVPWIEVSATNTRNNNLDVKMEMTNGVEVGDRLESLGYK